MVRKGPATDESFGTRLRTARRRRKLTLKQLSDLARLSVSFLSDLERGRTLPSAQSIQRIADALELSPSALLEEVRFGDGQYDWPPGLEELRNDSNFGPELTDEWMRTLARIQHRGRQPETKDEWLELFLHLRRILDS